MSVVLVVFCAWVAGIISGILLGAQDRKYSPQSVAGLLIVPPVVVASFLLGITLVLKVAPLVSLDATATRIVEMFAK